ncbi:MGH1-like glycoside hydrolase domain-containing protein [Streptomyces sp. XH2]|uniref:MGH1-like glycoside hydrolase domain-containing protein n=1 Tax=Streptomyces sp. XH2 TaxID=3412483 RepID=UPI003C7AE715
MRPHPCALFALALLLAVATACVPPTAAAPPLRSARRPGADRPGVRRPLAQVRRRRDRRGAGRPAAARRQGAGDARDQLAQHRRELAHDGITPSLSYKWFAGGFWAWDTWKQAVGTARFDAGLAEDQIRSVLDHQIRPGSTTRPQDAGMIPDAVFYNDPQRGGTNWNERNSKPPLSPWSVWQAYERSGNVPGVVVPQPGP